MIETNECVTHKKRRDPMIGSRRRIVRFIGLKKCELPSYAFARLRVCQVARFAGLDFAFGSFDAFGDIASQTSLDLFGQFGSFVESRTSCTFIADGGLCFGEAYQSKSFALHVLDSTDGFDCGSEDFFAFVFQLQLNSSLSACSG